MYCTAGAGQRNASKSVNKSSRIRFAPHVLDRLENATWSQPWSERQSEPGELGVICYRGRLGDRDARRIGSAIHQSELCARKICRVQCIENRV